MINKTETWLARHKGLYTGLKYLYVQAHNLHILKDLPISISNGSIVTYHQVFWQKYDK